MVFIHAIAGSNPAATTIRQKRSHLWLVFCSDGGREEIAHPAATTIFYDSMAERPGRSLLRRNSRAAPPPVEMRL